jgi:hypothetical protein
MHIDDPKCIALLIVGRCETPDPSTSPIAIVAAAIVRNHGASAAAAPYT